MVAYKNVDFDRSNMLNLAEHSNNCKENVKYFTTKRGRNAIKERLMCMVKNTALLIFLMC